LNYHQSHKRRYRSGPKLDKAREIVRPLVASGAATNASDIGGKNDITRRTVDQAVMLENERLTVLEELGASVSEVGFTVKQGRRLEVAIKAAIARHKRKLDEQFEERTRADVEAWVAKYLAPREREAREQIELYQSLVADHRPIFTQAEFNVVLKCLHPDRAMGATHEERNAAMRVFLSQRQRLTGKKD
jgi:hypothetical protein